MISSEHTSARRRLHVVPATALAVAIAYYLGARLGLGLSLVEENVTPLWPPTGIAVAAFLVLGRSLWPAVAVAAFAVNLPISEGVVAAAVTALGNTLAPWVAAALLEGVGFRRQLDRLRDIAAVVFLGALASMLISASIGSLTLLASGAIAADRLPSTWAVWWTGDAMGVLTITPFLLSVRLLWDQRRWPWQRWVEALLVLTAITAVSLVVAHAELQLLFLVLPMLGWAAWQLQLPVVAPGALVTSLIVTWSAVQEQGPFSRGTLLEQMLLLQAFNACVALTSLVLAALVSERLRAAEALAVAAAELEERVQQRTQELSQEEARATREHTIATILQRSLLPETLPEAPGVTLAVRYVPATSDVQVGGDWYDVVPLPGGLVGLTIGDVAGHGLSAAATMGQVRMAVRAYALQDPSPESVLTGVHRLVTDLDMPDMVTLTYLLLDPVTRTLRLANAGHPPALVIDAAGEVSFLEAAQSPPVGVTAEAAYPEVVHELEPGTVLLLYTDGLVERRGISIQDGLDRLALAAGNQDREDLEALCDSLLGAMLGDDRVGDDVAMLAVRTASLVDGPLEVRLPADPRNLRLVRSTLRHWLQAADVGAAAEHDILLACGEACANVVQHAYGVTPGAMELRTTLRDGRVALTVRDQGTWRPAAERGGGWGLQLMRELMDSVEVLRDPGGTEVRMLRTVETGGGA